MPALGNPEIPPIKQSPEKNMRYLTNILLAISLLAGVRAQAATALFE
jgi:hypothetical protein